MTLLTKSTNKIYKIFIDFFDLKSCRNFLNLRYRKSKGKNNLNLFYVTSQTIYK